MLLNVSVANKQHLRQHLNINVCSFDDDNDSLDEIFGDDLDEGLSGDDDMPIEVTTAWMSAWIYKTLSPQNVYFYHNQSYIHTAKVSIGY